MRQAQSAKRGVDAAGGTPREFCTITVTDGIAMGHQGMKSSLVSREVIADSIELTMRGHCYDAMVGLAGCDKSLPGVMMAMLRLNVPSVFMYGGSILPGKFKGKDVTVVDVFEGVGQHSAGKMSDKDLHELECVACPGAGACGGQFTANTMATVCETLGISPFGSASVPERRWPVDRFAAVAPICGPVPNLPGFPGRVSRLVSTPVHAFHGALDRWFPGIPGVSASHSRNGY
jgi:dihydroxy-acid dehydratase